MAITTADIQTLRQQTGVGILEAKKALLSADGNMTKAVEILRKAGVKLAAKKSDRAVKEGVIGMYIHANHKIGAMVALACETDFVARTEDFQNLAHDLAIHVAAANPRYLQPSQIPDDVIASERDIYQAQLKAEGKPEKMWEKIVDGKLEKFYAETCFLAQPFVKDDQQTIAELVQSAVTRLGENIQIVSFNRETV